jgi:exodeoxyribonuclease-5
VPTKDPTSAQAAVLAEIRDWLTSPHAPQWRYLAGAAGTGKTFLASLVAEMLPPGETLFAAFTGKAAGVLRSKGCAGAMTLHQLIYRPTETRGADGKYSTTFAPREDSPVAEARLIILDEVSMINATMAQDLLSFGAKVLVLGDPYQLPPVSGEGYFTKKDPHWLLTEVHRQAAESGILRLATDIREGRGIVDPRSYGPEAVVISMEEAGEHEAELLDWATQADGQIIVGTHRLRHYFNNLARSRAGFSGPLPRAGDSLVCLQNDHRRGLLNGGLWTVIADAEPSGTDSASVFMQSVDDRSAIMNVDCWTHDFEGREKEFENLPWSTRSRRARLTYGYALTCHKSQGSEFSNVLLMDESSAFRDDAARWLYTAITRASQKLVVVGR